MKHPDFENADQAAVETFLATTFSPPAEILAEMRATLAPSSLLKQLWLMHQLASARPRGRRRGEAVH